MINPQKSMTIPDDQMEIDDDDDENHDEIGSEDDLRGMNLPSVVQSTLQAKLSRKNKGNLSKEFRSQNQDEEENSTRKSFREKVKAKETNWFT